MTRHPELWAALAAEFDATEVKTRDGGGGRQLRYITARTAMNRLDEVVGPENWSDRFYEVCGVLFCEIAITLPDGSRVSKSDAGGFKQMTERRNGQVIKDEENTDKTGASDAFKRAAAKFGVGRYLYRDGVPSYQPEVPLEREPGCDDDRRPSDRPKPTDNPGAPFTGASFNGKGLYRFLREFDKRIPGGLVSIISRWGTERGYPTRILDWSIEECRAGYEQAKRLIAAQHYIPLKGGEYVGP